MRDMQFLVRNPIGGRPRGKPRPVIAERHLGRSDRPGLHVAQSEDQLIAEMGTRLDSLEGGLSHVSVQDRQSRCQLDPPLNLQQTPGRRSTLRLSCLMAEDDALCGSAKS